MIGESQGIYHSGLFHVSKSKTQKAEGKIELKADKNIPELFGQSNSMC